MQTEMTLNRHTNAAASPDWPLALFWVVALVGLGILIGAAGDAYLPDAQAVTPAPDAVVEDWHGNVRRGG